MSFLSLTLFYIYLAMGVEAKQMTACQFILELLIYNCTIFDFVYFHSGNGQKIVGMCVLVC